MKNNKKGFTLMEMLIVVAIIAVLVAIAIPVLNGALEKSREATDAANLRAAYAEVMVCALNGEVDADNEVEVEENTTTGGATYNVWTKEVDAVQTQTDWQNKAAIENIGGVAIDEITAVTKGGKWKVTYNENTGKVTFPTE